MKNEKKVLIRLIRILKKSVQCIVLYVRAIVAAITMTWFITTFLIANTIVISGSMEPTLTTGCRIIGNRIAYKFGNLKPKPGDILIFKNPDYESIYYVKRLIGIPGDTIELVPDVRGGYVNRNGMRLVEPYLKEPMTVERYEKYVVPKDRYFFMGDNRNNSYDSRYWLHPYVEENKIIAKVLNRR